MKFKTTDRTDLVNILMLIEAVENGVSVSHIDVYDYLSFTNQELIQMVNEKSSNLVVNV